MSKSRIDRYIVAFERDETLEKSRKSLKKEIDWNLSSESSRVPREILVVNNRREYRVKVGYLRSDKGRKNETI